MYAYEVVSTLVCISGIRMSVAVFPGDCSALTNAEVGDNIYNMMTLPGSRCVIRTHYSIGGLLGLLRKSGLNFGK